MRLWTGFLPTAIFVHGRRLLPGVIILVGSPAFQRGPATRSRWSPVWSWLQRGPKCLTWRRLEVLVGSGLALELWSGLPGAAVILVPHLLALLQVLPFQLLQVVRVVHIVVLRVTFERPLLYDTVNGTAMSTAYAHLADAGCLATRRTRPSTHVAWRLWPAPAVWNVTQRRRAIVGAPCRLAPAGGQ